LSVGYGLDDRGRIDGGVFFSPTMHQDWLWGPPSLLLTIHLISRVFPLVVKQIGREADHLIASSVVVRNAWSNANNLPYVFMVKCLKKPGNNFNLPLLYHYYLKHHKANDNIIH
jgi:hypothetical protein